MGGHEGGGGKWSGGGGIGREKWGETAAQDEPPAEILGWKVLMSPGKLK